MLEALSKANAFLYSKHMANVAERKGQADSAAVGKCSDECVCMGG